MGVIGDSAVPAFQDALKTQLLARPGFIKTSVSIGPPSPGIAQELSWVALLECVGTENWAAMGRRQKQEDYTQKIYISVMTRDGEGDSARGRDMAYVIRKEIADQLLADPTVNATVWQAQLTGKQEFLPRLGIQVPDSSGGTTTDLTWREACLQIEIKFKNRI